MHLNPLEPTTNFYFSTDPIVGICCETNSLTFTTNETYKLELKRWPLLFKLAKVLVENKGYVSKEKISSLLWDNSKYLPRSTDPKIYDIVRRLKAVIDLDQNFSIEIQSSLEGYKLEAFVGD